jgi:predicted transcriptional regulator of viral defense system
MKWGDLLALVGREPVFTSALLKTRGVSEPEIRLQLSRWTSAGKLLQLRRRVYAIAPPYRKIEPHPFLIANHLRRASYVSLQSALAHHGMIPELVPVTTSITTGRPEQLETPLGPFAFRHMKPALFFGYHQVEVERGQQAFVARPEKALLDLIYLTPGAGQESYLEELRLQRLEVFDQEALTDLAARFSKPKITRAADMLLDILDSEVKDTV